jgi:hypothetical protein
VAGHVREGMTAVQDIIATFVALIGVALFLAAPGWVGFVISPMIMMR